MKVIYSMRWLFLLRAFFPAWFFFIEPGVELHLEAKTDQQSWFGVLRPIDRSIKNLVWGAENNYLHACRNSLEHLLQDVSEMEVPEDHLIEKLTSFRIIKNLVEFELKQQNRDYQNFQFRIQARYPQFQNRTHEIFLISPVYRVETCV